MLTITKRPNADTSSTMADFLPPVVLFDPDVHSTPEIIAQMAQIHADCVLQDGTHATFLPDPSTGEMDMPKLRGFWEATTAETRTPHRVIALQFSTDAQTELIGFGGLHMPHWQTGPFRSQVQKLLVHPGHRRKGAARRVMAALESVAVERDAGLIVRRPNPLSLSCFSCGVTR